MTVLEGRLEGDRSVAAGARPGEKQDEQRRYSWEKRLV